MQRCYFLMGLLLLTWSLSGQTFQHLDYLGAGHDYGVEVSSSPSEAYTAQETVDGFDIQHEEQLKAASRFLAQATFGADLATIKMVAAMGYEAWLEEQFALPAALTLEELLQQHALYTGLGEEEEVWSAHFKMAWSTNVLTSPDQLRQRMAYALSQIMVVNSAGDLFNDFAQAQGSYYDVLLTNAFGAYQELLLDVALSPTMGVFLSHYNNPKANPELNIHPDENFAREIMQLFSIGLWEMNPNGSYQYDVDGQYIPTYTNADIKEMAQVFTGLGDGAHDFFGPVQDSDHPPSTLSTPMRMYEEHHDKSEKRLLNGVVLPAGQSGMEDIRQAVAHLAEHNNTAPFIARALIQRFTTSNPSPAYIAHVAEVFEPNAANNFQEVLKAILLYPEARSCQLSEQYGFGKLREPVIRLTNFLKAFHLEANPAADFPMELECFYDHVGQAPLDAPSVFNFYRPDYAPQGSIEQRYLVAPEFQIMTAPNTIGYINELEQRVNRQEYTQIDCNPEASSAEEAIDYGDDLAYLRKMDVEPWLAWAEEPETLVDYLDIVLANGLLSESTRQIIQAAIEQLPTALERFKMATYLILLSPDYIILK